MKRYALLLGPGLFTLAGCIPFVPCYYALPSISHVPSVEVAEAKEEIHAFRVDATDKKNCLEFADLGTYTFREIPISSKGTVSGQTQLAVDYGMVWNCIALIFDKHTVHSVKLRIYRPGYEIVEIDSWRAKSEIEWKRALGAAEQEKVIDGLLDGPASFFYGKEGDGFFPGLPAGSTCEGHRKALLFASSEYERLAAQLAAGREDTEQSGKRLLDKASELKALAAN